MRGTLAFVSFHGFYHPAIAIIIIRALQSTLQLGGFILDRQGNFLLKRVLLLCPSKQLRSPRRELVRIRTPEYATLAHQLISLGSSHGLNRGVVG